MYTKVQGSVYIFHIFSISCYKIMNFILRIFIIFIFYLSLRYNIFQYFNYFSLSGSSAPSPAHIDRSTVSTIPPPRHLSP